MAIVNILDKVTEWVQAEICEKVKLKLPSEKKISADAVVPTDEKKNFNENYELVTPTAFTLFVPTKDRKPPNVRAPIPSVCIRLLIGEDMLLQHKGEMKLQFYFCAWNPGIFGTEIFNPVEGEPLTYRKWNDPDAMWYYERRSDGWRDGWGFVDTALRVIESEEYISGYRIVKEKPVEYGPATEEESIPDYYPYWYAWISFTIQYGVIRNNEKYKEFL